MKPKLPILIIIPHGGRMVPDELSGYELIDEFGIFIESDVYANELFNFEFASAKIDTQISHLFVDLDTPLSVLSPHSSDGIIRKESLSGRKILKDKIFPDEIAIANIIKRYYLPFHNYIIKTIEKGDLKLIIECRTMLPVGPRLARDAGEPRPLINIENIIQSEIRTIRTCSAERAENFLSCFKKYFSHEDCTVSEKFSMNKPLTDGYILKNYGQSRIPMLRLSVSTSLYLNDKYFNYDFLTLDSGRVEDLRKRLWAGIEKYALKYLA